MILEMKERLKLREIWRQEAVNWLRGQLLNLPNRDKLMAIIDIFSDSYEETALSVMIPETQTKLMFTPEGEIRSIIRGGRSYGPEVKA